MRQILVNAAAAFTDRLRGVGGKPSPIILVLGLALMFSGLVQYTANAQDSRLVTIYADDEAQSFTTRAETVGAALERANISLHEKDLVEPELSADITTDSFKINVYRARPVLVVDGGKQHQVLTPYQSPRLIAEDAGLTVYPEDEYELERINEFVDYSTIGLRLTIDRSTPIELNMYGAREELRTQAETVGEFVKTLELSGNSDEVVVRPQPDKPIKKDMAIHVVAVSDDTIAVEEPIPFERREIKDTSRPLGYENIRTPGQNGSKLVTYKVVYENGQETSRKAIDTVIVEQPVEEVAVVGANYRDNYPDNNAILAALRSCEGSYTSDTGNGFYGAYQFMQDTWNRTAQRMGMTEWVNKKPSTAPASVQDMFVVNNAKASAGGFWSQHPGCSEKLNLPQFPY